DGKRPAGEVHAVPAPAQRPARAAAGGDRPGRPLGRRPGERLAPEHHPLAEHRRPDPADPRRGAVRHGEPARAADARDLRRHARDRAVPGRRHASRARQPRLDALRPPLLGLPDGPRRRAHRRLADGGRVGRALAAGRLPSHPERRLRAAGSRSRRPRPRDRLHRPARSAQGPADSAARLAGDPPRDRREAAAHRYRPAPVPAHPLAPSLRRGRHRRARDRPERGAHARAPAREGARHAGDRAGELRPCARRGARMRDTGRRLQHSRLRRGLDARVDDARTAVRSRRARRRGRRPAVGRGAPRRDGPRRACARARELRLGRHRTPARGGLHRGVHVKRWLPFLVALPLLAVGIILVAWRGPDWHIVRHAFVAVSWPWVAAAIGLNLLSVVTRSMCWDTCIRQALAPPQPAYRLVFSAFCVGLFANAVLPGRVGELARAAVLRRRMPGRKGATATLIGSVFAHRVFDLFPTLVLVVWVLVAADIPQWAYLTLAVAIGAGILLFLAAVVLARRQHREIEGLGPVRLLFARGRAGLAIMSEPRAAVQAATFQFAGWLCQLFAVWSAMRAFQIDEPLAAAGLVLVLMNVATIVPL